MLADVPVFLAQWLRDPLGIGSALPTNPLVGRAVARWLALDVPGAIVELGGGIGSVTRGLLQAGCPADRLVVIEREPAFVDILERRFSEVRILGGDATDLRSLLQRAGIGKVAGIVSCLPIKWFSLEQQRAIVEQGFELLDPRGSLLQLTNASSSPLPMEELGLTGSSVARVWLNFLPIQIWRYTRSAAEGLGPQGARTAA